MLAKLLKYEIRATSRQFLPIYGGLLALSVVMRVFMMNDFGDNLQGTALFLVELFSVIVSLLYAFLICTMFALTAFVMIQRFYKNLLGDEGYLMFTLPVKTWMHIASKALVSALWIVASCAAVVLSAFIVSFSAWDVVDFFRGLAEIFPALQRMSATDFIIMMEALFFLMLCLFSGIIMVYTAIAIGQLWSRHKILGGFCAFIGIWVFLMVLASVTINTVGVQVLDTFGGMSVYTEAIHFVLLIADFMGLLVCAAGCFVTNFILTRRLNLE